MKTFLKVFFLSVVLVCLGALTLLSADAAVGTEAELQAAINAANASSGSATTITLTGNVTVSADGTFTVNGKNIVIDGAGKYSITRATVNTSMDYLFEITNGSKVEFRNVTVDNNVYTFRMENGANSTLTLGAGATAKGKTTADFADPIVVFNGSGNVFYLQAGATIQKDSTVNARSMLIKTAGTAHIYGALIDNTPGNNKNHRIIYGTGGTVNIYEGAVLTATNDGGNNDGTAMIWAGCTTLNIYGGTFTQTGWDADASPDKAPHGMIALYGGASAVANISGGTFVMGAADKTAVAVAPIFLSISGGTLNITGGSFTQNYASPLFATHASTNLKTLNITGGTFVQNGAANAFHFTAGTTPPTITVGGNAKITNNYNTSDGAATGAGRIFHFAVPATLTVGGTAELTAFNSVVHVELTNVTVTAKDNARFLAKHSKAWAFNFRGGTSVLTLQDNAYVRAGSYDAEGNSVGAAADINSYGVVLLERDAKGGGLTVNMSGNAYIEAQNSGIYLDMDSVTDTAKACALNLTGGTIISHQNFAINLKTKAIVSVSAIKNMKMDSYAACFNVETVTFTNSTLAFENCSMITRNTPTDTGAAVVRFGFTGVTPTGVTSISFTNCSLESSTYSLVIGPNSSSVTSVKFRTTGAGNYTLKGAISCAAKSGSNPTAVTTFSIEGTGTVTMNKVTLTQPSTVNTIAVTGVGTLTLTDCSFTQTGNAAALLKVSAAATVNVGGSTLLSNAASNRAYAPIVLSADAKLNIYGTAQVTGVSSVGNTSAITTEKGAPTIRIYGTPTLNSDTYTFNFQGGSPVVSVEGGTLNGSYIVAYNNSGDYLTSGGFITVNVSGGTFNPDVYSAFYIASSDAAKNVLNITGGTFTAVSNTQAFNNVITANSSAVLEVNVSGGDFTDTDAHAVFYAGANAKITATVTGGKLAGVLTNAVGKITLSITGGTLGTDAAGVSFTGSGATVNVYGGLFKSSAAYVLLVDSGANVTVFGGTFLYNGTTGNPVTVGNNTNSTNGTLTVNGGAFRAPKDTTHAFFMKLTAASTLTLNSCTLAGKGSFYTDYTDTSAVRSFNQKGMAEYSAHNALDLKNGATLRLVKGSAGLRFVTNISKATYDHYLAMADNGSVTYGTLIFPAKYAEWMDTYVYEYSKAALDKLGLQYLDIPAVNGLSENADGSWTMNAAIANIKDENVQLSFTALSYVTYTVNGITVTQYANHDAVKNERTVYQVARAAANDVSAAEQGAYVYEITSNGNSAYVGKYSPYSAEQWTLIGKWWAWNNTTKKEVETIDLYLIAGQSNAVGYSTITTAFQNAHGKETFPNIYYAGGKPQYMDTVNGIIKLGAASLYPASQMKTVFLGLGAYGKEIGAEYGMATILKNYYNAQTGKKAAIVKYAMGGTVLSDVITGQNNYGGNWSPPSYLAQKTPAGIQSGALYEGFVYQVASAVEDYRAMGFIVNIKGVFWMQGESDRGLSGINGAVDTLGSYRNMFRYLVNDMRADLHAMTPYSTDLVEVYVGEISKKCGGAENTQNNNFIAMQNTLDEISGLPGIHIIASSKYTTFRSADDNFHWVIDEMYSIGKLVGNAMVQYSMN